MPQGRPFNEAEARDGAKYYSASDPSGQKWRHYTFLAKSKAGIIIGEQDNGMTLTADATHLRMAPAKHVKYCAKDINCPSFNNAHLYDTRAEAEARCAEIKANSPGADNVVVATIEWTA